ncbi:Trypomastigote Alanine Serine and Valine rich protein (TASV) subfamily A [Trypanosoma cruzi]|uniref:Trypomastigote Alanine Serine and Valine rich protein (TASV) subfamily A n=1 Tax=Trypanosoma cruzi TaxID=5693 RepID=A0A7J6XMN6_TRYCR|nr:Trypomastigote Alanine Serine and Valine rich protein (TASV) subfamily A [Trypanosoma cruzi]
MMMMATVRRRVACYLLVLALLCSSSCMSVSGCCFGRKLPLRCRKTWTDVEVVPGTDGRLGWRPSGENDWRRCAKKPGEYESVTDECARLCDDAGEFYTSNITGRCPPEGAGKDFALTMRFATYGNIQNCTSAPAENRPQLGAGDAQPGQSQPQAGAAAAPKTAGDDLRRSGVSGPPGKAAATPQNKPPDHTDKVRVPSRPSENAAATAWVRMPLLLLLTVLVCAAVR